MTYTKASPDRPLRRKVLVNGRPYIVEIYQDFLTLRPSRVRRPDAIVSMQWGSIYTRALLNRPAKRPRKASRGLLRGSR